MHDPRIGRFFAIDPLADDYPYLTTYSFSGNRVIDAIELEGMEPIVFNGQIVGYEVQPGQGPSQVAADINDIKTQKEYGYSHKKPVTWSQVVSWNFDAFKDKGDWNGNPNGIFDKHAEEFKRLNINKGDILFINDYANKELNIIYDSFYSGINAPNLLGSTADVIGGLGTGMTRAGGTFRLTNGQYNGSQISLKHYESGWRGGSRARISTHSMSKAGRFIGRAGTLGTIVLGSYDVYSNLEAEDFTFGTQTQRATGRAVGSLAGGIFGAKVGAAVGALFGGVGAVPGAIIGGFIGGWLGSEGGEAGVEYIQDQNNLNEIRAIDNDFRRSNQVIIPAIEN